MEGSDRVWGTGSGKEEGLSQVLELMSKAGSWRAGNKAQPRRPVNIGQSKLNIESNKSFFKCSHIAGKNRVGEESRGEELQCNFSQGWVQAELALPLQS